MIDGPGPHPPAAVGALLPAAAERPGVPVGTDRGAGEPLVLTVDLGSSGLKVGYTTLRGRIEWWADERLISLAGPDGAVTQDADDWWQRIRRLARQGQDEGGIDGARVVGVGITGQWASTVPVDADGRPVGPVVMWNDGRGAEHSRAVVGGRVAGYRPTALAVWLRRTGGAPNPTGQDALAHHLHLLRDQPEVAAAARWFLEPVDALAMRFTGRAVATPASMIGAWLTDNRDPVPRAYDEVLVRRSGVDAGKLAPLVPTGSIVGPVLPEVAAEFGIPPTARVVSGLPDLHVAVIGSGCTRDFQAHLSIGTTAWITCPVPFKRTDVLRQLASIPGIGDGRYILVNNQDSAGRAVEWFRETLRGLTGAPVEYEQLLAAAATAPPGSGGVLFTPWLTGERSPIDDRNARAGFHNVGVDSGPAELSRAVLEGVAHNARLLLDAAERFAGRALDPLRIVGGGARSDLWCQIVADVTEHRIERVQDPMCVGLRGAGLLVGMAFGEVRAARVPELVPVDRVFTPDPASVAAYRRVLPEFPRLHARNKGMFRRLNA
ncbi:MAG: FGGY-family carbohydrate kinase [Candidatus Nanopelagicales bacterium]|nr:FGGY-family carbohydrate kinase [Candidatus Nanopelagicales bacterium]